MSWQILIGISVLIYSVSVLMQRVLLKEDKSDPISFSIFFQIGVAFVTTILVLLINGSIPIPDLANISWSVVVMTVLYALANIFIFKSLKTTEASNFTIIFSSKTLFAVLGSIFVFKENLSVDKLFGVLLILIGVVVVSIKKFELKFKQGEIYAFLAAIAFGLANTNDGFLVKFFDPYSYVVIGFLLPGILIAIIYPKKLSNVKDYLKKNIVWKMALLCGLYGISAVAFFAALQVVPNVSQAFAINAFGGVLTVILSVILLKEKDNLPRKIIGAILSLVGVLLVNGL